MQTNGRVAITDHEKSRVDPTTSKDVAIQFEDVSLRYETDKGETVALQHLDLTIHKGEFVAVVGPSGCGKSTLLGLAAGLKRPSAGRVIVSGATDAKHRRDVGFVTQHDNLLPWRTAAQNVALSLELQGVPRRQRRARVDEMLALVGLDGFGSYYPSQLSGGMRKRVTLARTLCNSPSILLLDEPFGALDAQLRSVLHKELLRIWEAMRCTIVFITHDLDEAIALADRVVVMKARPSRVVRDEANTIPRPRDLDEVRLTPEFRSLFRTLRQELSADQVEGHA